MEGRVAKMRVFTVMLPVDLLETVRRLAAAKRISAGAMVRLLLSERLMQLGELEPQPPRSGPLGPGVSAMGAAGRAGPETGGDAPRLIGKNQEEGGGKG
jgi:hypothetical protein